jgi:peptide/nickel transport system permease protein
MTKYVATRLAWAVVVALGVVTAAFFILYVVPADPARAAAGAQASSQAVANVRKQLGLDAPLVAQYGRYVWGLLNGNLGFSFDEHQSVTSLIGSRLTATVILAFSGMAIALTIGAIGGAVAAVRPGGWVDRLVLLLASVLVSLPQMWVGLLLLYYLAARLAIFPIGGYGSVGNLVLPALTLGLTGAAWYARVMRTSVGEARQADHVRTARAKGLPKRTVGLWHVAPSCVTPLLTLVGLDLATYIAGVVVVETVFGWPGIGQLAWQAIGQDDLPVILGVVLVTAIAVVIVNLLIDIGYGVVDPRVRYGR